MSYALTLVAANPDYPLDASLTQQFYNELSANNIQKTAEIKWLSPQKAVDLYINRLPEKSLMEAFRAAMFEYNIDVYCVPMENRRKQGLIMDMDKTTVPEETLDVLAALAEAQYGYTDIAKDIAAITLSAMKGEIDFDASVKQRVGKLKGLTVEAIDEILENLPLNPGVRTLVATMKENGGKVAVLVSGGYTVFTGPVGKQGGFDFDHGNELIINEGVLTGDVALPIQDKNTKLILLRRYAEQYGLSPEDFVTKGDGSNDLLMLLEAGLGMGYHPKDIVKQQVYNYTQHGDHTNALYVQGYTDAEFVRPEKPVLIMTEAPAFV